MLEMVIDARAADLGHGLTVRRVLPYAKRRMVGPFIFVDHAGPVTLAPEDTRAADVRPHPHIGLSTVSYLLSGQVMHRDSLGVVIGGSGNGEQIAANKVRGVRAALVWNEETAVLAREHNDANVVAVGGRMHTVEEMTRFVGVFLATPFPGEERHRRRIGMLADYERSGELPPLPESALGGSRGAATDADA